MEQSGNGLASRMLGSALIPLVGNNSRLIIIPMQMPIFIQITWWLGFTFRSACLASYYLFIYLFTLYNPNGLYSNRFGETNSDETYGVGSETCYVTLVKNFRHRGALILDIS